MKTCFASLKRVTENRKQLERYARNRTEGILIDIYTNVPSHSLCFEARPADAYVTSNFRYRPPCVTQTSHSCRAK